MRYYLGSLYDRQGKLDQGIVQEMEEILKRNPEHVDALNYIGYTWTVKGIRLSDAAKLIQKALKLKPENAYIQDSWGYHLFITGKINDAIMSLEKAVSLRPNEPTILEHLADAYARANLPEKAATTYDKALRLTDSDKSKKDLAVKLTSMQKNLLLVVNRLKNWIQS